MYVWVVDAFNNNCSNSAIMTNSKTYFSKNSLVFFFFPIRKAFHQDRKHLNSYVVFKEQKAAKDALQE